MADFSAIAYRSASEAKALRNHASSTTNCLPHAPDGALNRLGLQ